MVRDDPRRGRVPRDPRAVCREPPPSLPPGSRQPEFQVSNLQPLVPGSCPHWKVVRTTASLRQSRARTAWVGRHLQMYKSRVLSRVLASCPCWSRVRTSFRARGFGAAGRPSRPRGARCGVAARVAAWAPAATGPVTGPVMGSVMGLPSLNANESLGVMS